MPLDVAAMVKALLGTGSLIRFHNACYAKPIPILTHLSPRELRSRLRAWLRSKQPRSSNQVVRLDTASELWGHPQIEALEQNHYVPFAAPAFPNLNQTPKKPLRKKDKPPGAVVIEPERRVVLRISKK